MSENSSGLIIWIIVGIIIILIIIFIIIILVVFLSSSNNTDNTIDINGNTNVRKEIEEEVIDNYDNMVCSIQRDCPSGYICSKGKCKKGLGEVCIPDRNKDNGDCYDSYVCDGVCRKRSSNEKKKLIRRVRIKEGNIQNESMESSSADTTRYYRDNDDDSSDYSDEHPNEHPVDICCYSVYVVYLMNTGNILLDENGVSRKVTSDTHIKNICNFNGYINGISTDGNLYYLDNDTLERNQWKWKKISVVSDIIDFSVTHDGLYLWVRTSKVGLLYNRDFTVVEKIVSPEKRIYGVDRNNYLVVDEKGITSYPNVKYHGKSDGVIDLLIDHKGIIHTLTKKKYRMIKMINYEVCYIS